ncbi:hypothetical protein EGR_07220 [Echinococcus granulosus]|uniref:Uncharacterized protein n=1 Tax=Echinococcus granulosus TaxID=6210 RepID=W6UA79_ECHGR|nr:hypothetical protein EGR_07220 [Echinococcus granulosus]EUB57950.1 hypothetical protein EGR_07220 [Echinococcus granulosus]
MVDYWRKGRQRHVNQLPRDQMNYFLIALINLQSCAQTPILFIVSNEVSA